MRQYWIPALAAALCAVAPMQAMAQAPPPGASPAMGGGRGRGSGGGRIGSGATASQHANAGDDLAARFEEMARLKPVLTRIDLDRAQRDTMHRLEAVYKEDFRGYGRAARDLFAKGMPDTSDVRKLRSDAAKLRDEEFAAARKLLTEKQAAVFDENVATVREDDANRERELRERRRQRGDGIGAGPP